MIHPSSLSPSTAPNSSLRLQFFALAGGLGILGGIFTAWLRAGG